MACFMSVMSPTKFCLVTQIILQVLSCDQSLTTVAFHEKLSQVQFYKNLTGLVHVQWSWACTKYGLEILQQCVKRFWAKSHKFLRAFLSLESFWWCYRGKPGRRCRLFALPPILNWAKVLLVCFFSLCLNK